MTTESSNFLSGGESSENWMSVSDLMAGLMMVFMLIVVVYVKQIFEGLGETKDRIRTALEEEFKDDKERWQMGDIDPDTLTIKFLSPEIGFAKSSDEISPKFKEILDDFFPRYIKLLHDNFKEDIEEVRVEGHASSEWKEAMTVEKKFFNNMDLSQKRALSVMVHCLYLPSVDNLMSWMIKTVSANGHSSAKPKLRETAVGRGEDRAASRRVDFAIRTKEALQKVSPVRQK